MYNKVSVTWRCISGVTLGRRRIIEVVVGYGMCGICI